MTPANAEFNPEKSLDVCAHHSLQPRETAIHKTVSSCERRSQMHTTHTIRILKSEQDWPFDD